ncbi:ABC transporter permease [Paracoccus spongiarum]|uniref:ABC transporter permease n=1 Tax=Paracoccus spongiarum TaxID=3064387 RepID=A0ABT9JAU3_9RHOB|nr:ABC transporter permease [Paracoccus sp. 2205BS29-5]MDP5306925.1 ABC transporter permease [Paracoccus sp. 2205BS29-5]
MAAIDPTQLSAPDRKARRLMRITRAEGWFRVLGLPFMAPLLRAAAGDDPRGQLKVLWQTLFAPVLAILAFLGLWAMLAPQVQTSLGSVPGPAQVWSQAVALHQDAVREGEKRDEFYVRQDERNARLIADGQPDKVQNRDYTGRPTFYMQIWTSIQTVFAGFLIGTVIAVPLGIAAGLSPTVNAAINPLVQIFKPVSPLAWLPIVTMVVSALATGEGGLPRSFIVSAITVTLCSLWPTLINTSLGVASIDRDLVNVGRVLKLSPWARVTRLVLPSALPLIFTGLRLSLGVGWMVLIAAEMLAQNPGLGKFVWDEFQNGSSDSLARIMVAVLTIGIIGFLLDRMMFAIQSLITFSDKR